MMIKKKTVTTLTIERPWLDPAAVDKRRAIDYALNNGFDEYSIAPLFAQRFILTATKVDVDTSEEFDDAVVTSITRTSVPEAKGTAEVVS